MGIVAKYKYDGSVYADLIPEFNPEFTDYTITDEVEGNIITRTIESDSLPTLMRFGTTHEWVGGEGKSSLLEIIKLDTSNLTSMYCMFRDCAYVTSINTDGWNTSKITDMTSIFNGCGRLTSLDLSNLDTSAAIYFKKMFIGCSALTSIDTSIWKTNKVIDTLDMFRDCTKLKLLDISNYDLTNVTLSSEMFTGTEKLTDIGMIYCDQSTINKVASLLPTDHDITIWVESDDILQYDQYDHITYKTQKVQDTVHLNSPLLIGDTIEVIDGKTYHVHRYEKVVLNGSEDWGVVNAQTVGNSYLYQTPAYNGIIASENHVLNILCDKMDVTTANGNWNNTVLKNGISLNRYGNFSIRCENITNANDLKVWLSNNVLNIIVPLVTPYYELISEEPLELTLVDTTDNTINNNSILPSNMTIANKELSTIAIKPSTTYTLSFDKSNEDSEVTIDICGGEQITTVLNRVELTTPSKLGSGIRFISSDGCIISNVRLLEGSLVEKAIPKETFEGLQSSFEEGYIIGENLVPIGVNYQSDVTSKVTQLKKTIPAGTAMTIIIHTKQACKSCVRACLQLQDKDGVGSQISYVGAVNNSDYAINTGYHILDARTLTHDLSYINVWFNQVEGIVEYDEIYILEGDHTHLSEAELMRYIEKGTSHYEEEDYNHVGKYKVEYKVTGKNKFDMDNIVPYQHASSISEGVITSIKYSADYGWFRLRFLETYKLKAGTYYLQFKMRSDDYISAISHIHFEKTIDIDVLPHSRRLINPNCNSDYQIYEFEFVIEKEYNANYLFIQGNTTASKSLQIKDLILSEIQSTEYEPYKEDIKTYYLSSPLLEGDTIEDINGVATHVKRYGKVVLDGSNDIYLFSSEQDFCKFSIKSNNVLQNRKVICDRFISEVNWSAQQNTVFAGSGNDLGLIVTTTIAQNVDNMKTWLSKNPTTVVYQLASPIYEPISEESILCDSYVNGHLDVDTNIPIEKVYFDYLLLALKYVKPSTRYLLQFESDNVGVSTINIGGSTVSEVPIIKGINKVEITTLPTLTHQLLAFSGIGFNASNIQVVEANEDIEFGYFKGLQSSFEDGLVTDENDENYGKYKVECKIVGKNKWHLGDLYFDMKTIRSDKVTPLLKKGVYTLSSDTSINGATIRFMDNSDKEINWVLFGGNITVTLKEDVHTIHLYSKDWSSSLSEGNFATVNNIQLEEGTQATSYEPYKESIHTLYLNSPLLKGDKLVVHDGKLCHYHKMGMVVLDGNNILHSNTNVTNGFLRVYMYKLDKKALYPGLEGEPNCYSNQLQTLTRNFWANFNIESVSISDAGQLTFSKKIDTLEKLTQWLQQNPTTVVYELAEPYYEPIEPQLSQYSFSTVKDGDMEIITTLPIEKINLTYRTDINGVSSIEEQIASIQEGADISSIIDEEVDE